MLFEVQKMYRTTTVASSIKERPSTSIVVTRATPFLPLTTGSNAGLTASMHQQSICIIAYMASYPVNSIALRGGFCVFACAFSPC